MSDANKDKRLGKSKKLLEWLEHPEVAKMMKLYLSEKTFDHHQKSNKRNDTWLCKDPMRYPE